MKRSIQKIFCSILVAFSFIFIGSFANAKTVSKFYVVQLISSTEDMPELNTLLKVSLSPNSKDRADVGGFEQATILCRDLRKKLLGLMYIYDDNKDSAIPSNTPALIRKMHVFDPYSGANSRYVVKLVGVFDSNPFRNFCSYPDDFPAFKPTCQELLSAMS